MDSLSTWSIQSAGLARDQSWWEATLRKNPLHLQNMSREAQLLYPTAVVNSFSALRKSHPTNEQVLSVGLNIVPSIWESRENILRWYSAGLFFLPNVHPKDDEEICMLIAKYAGRDVSARLSFREATSLSLRNNKTFMLQAIQHNATLIDCASKTVQEDYRVALQAFADLSFWELVTFIEDHNLQDEAEDFVMQATTKLKLHSTFSATLLYGVSDASSPCAMLQQGTETSQSYKMFIAEYLGVPQGRELRLLRQACKKVEAVLNERIMSSYIY